MTKKFRDFVIMRLRQKYSKVIMRLIDIFEEKAVNIQKLITMLCFDDIENKSIFSQQHTQYFHIFSGKCTAWDSSNTESSDLYSTVSPGNCATNVSLIVRVV